MEGGRKGKWEERYEIKAREGGRKNGKKGGQREGIKLKGRKKLERK